MLKDDKTAIVTPDEFDALLEYSTSIPTGTIVGKVWKRKYTVIDKAVPLGITFPWPICDGRVAMDCRVEQKHDLWQLGEYVEDKDPTMIGIKWRDLLVVR